MISEAGYVWAARRGARPLGSERPDPGPDAATRALELVLDQERNHDAEERDAFDERGEDQSAGLDLPRHLRLAGHRFGHATPDQSDADAGSDSGDASADAGAEHAPRSRVLLIVRGRRRLGCALKKCKNGHGFSKQSIGHAVPTRDSPLRGSRRIRRPVSEARASTGLTGRSAGYDRTRGSDRRARPTPPDIWSPGRAIGARPPALARQCAPARIWPMKTAVRMAKMNACKKATKISRSEIATPMSTGAAAIQ